MSALHPLETLIIGLALLAVLVPTALLYVRAPGLKDELDAIFFRRVLALVLVFAGLGLLLGVAPTESGRSQVQDLALFSAVGAAGGFLAHTRLGGVLVAAAFVAGFGFRVAMLDDAPTPGQLAYLGRMVGIHTGIILLTALAGWLGGWGSIVLDRIRMPVTDDTRA